MVAGVIDCDVGEEIELKEFAAITFYQNVCKSLL